MEENVMFNLEDLNVKEESLNILEQPSKIIENTETNINNPVTGTEGDPPDGTEIEIKEEIEDEKKETDTEETKGKLPPVSDAKDSSHSTLYTLAKHLKEEGVLYLDEDIEKVESLADLKALVIKSNEQAKFAGLNDSQKRYHEALESGIPRQEFENVEKEIQAYKGITEDAIEKDANLRFEINALDLISKGLDKEKAIKLAKLAVQDEGNVDETKEALKNLIELKTNKFKTLVEESNKQTELTLTEIKDAVYNKKTLLENPLNDITKNKLFDLMTTKVETGEDGKSLNKLQKWQKDNPIEANLVLNYMFLMTNEGKDLGLIKKGSTSIAAKELEKKLKSMSFDETGALIIPDQMVNKAKSTTAFSGTDDLTINI